MTQLRANKPRQETNLFARILWRGAWLAQILLWGFLLFFVLHYWLSEAPAVRSYHESGLVQGFDGLAGVVASIDPTWEEVSKIAGHAGGNRLTRLQGDATFKVWREQDQMPTWNAGLASLFFDQQGGLIWARRYPVNAEAYPVEYIWTKTDDSARPVVYSWSDGRSKPGGRATDAAGARP